MFPPAWKERSLGLILLDTRFPRLPGDLGLANSWGVPVLQEVVRGAWPTRVVRSAAGLRSDAALVQAFVGAARNLQARGAAAITTSCGFLVLLQDVLQQAVDVPVFTSSLLLLPQCLAREPHVGVLTMDASSLEEDHLRCAGVAAHRLVDVLVEGMDPRGAFAGSILGNQATLDAQAARDEVLGAAQRLLARDPQLRTVVLECTNMPPHAAALAAGTGLQVLSLLDAVMQEGPEGPSCMR